MLGSVHEVLPMSPNNWRPSVAWVSGCSSSCASLLIRYWMGKHDIQLTNRLIGCLAVTLLAAVDSLPVTGSLLQLLDTVFQRAALGRPEPLTDQVDTGVVVVTSDKQRNVPVFNTPQDEFK